MRGSLLSWNVSGRKLRVGSSANTRDSLFPSVYREILSWPNSNKLYAATGTALTVAGCTAAASVIVAIGCYGMGIKNDRTVTAIWFPLLFPIVSFRVATTVFMGCSLLCVTSPVKMYRPVEEWLSKVRNHIRNNQEDYDRVDIWYRFTTAACSFPNLRVPQACI